MINHYFILVNLNHLINQHQILNEFPLFLRSIQPLDNSSIYRILLLIMKTILFKFNWNSPRTKITKYIQSVIEDDQVIPCDAHVHANIPGSLFHNLWPILWARCNHEAIRDAGKASTSCIRNGAAMSKILSIILDRRSIGGFFK